MLEIGERVIHGPSDATIGPEDTSLGVDSLIAIGLSLPSAASLDPTPGTRRLRIRDSGGHAGTAPITISAVGTTIDGSSAVVINQAFGGVVLEWEGVRWHILNLVGASGPFGLFTPAVPGDWTPPIPPKSPIEDAVNQAGARIKALETASVGTTETAGSALAVGRSVYRSSANKMLAESGTYAQVKDAFAGFTTSAAAALNDPVSVAGNGQRATGLSLITVGAGYYVSAGVLIPESGIVAFVAGASSGTAYRFVGTGDTATSIKTAWGEPQEKP